MERYSLKDAQNHLQELIDEAQDGKVILIEDEHERIVQLVPYTQYGPRKAGSARGQIKMAANFDAPIADFDEYVE